LILLAPPLGLLRADDLAATSVPILVVVGDDDEYAPLKELEPILATRTGLALVVIPGADHFFHFGGQLEIAVAVAEHVQRWRS
jgi:pimeloyl-ACP methyl ester carboxylesterase